MSLSELQRDQARFAGGKHLAATKAHLARTTTALRKVINGSYELGATALDAAKNAPLIRDLTTLAVAEQMERTR